MAFSRVLAPELQRIREDHPILASTGCTKDFCQSGRLIHYDEPRVGEDQPTHILEKEAEDFLRSLRADGLYKDDLAFQQRLKEVLQEIREGAVETITQEEISVHANTTVAMGGCWKQTSQELHFGIRRAWRNSRKCIMRSHCDELKLCDLREVTSSVQMVAELLKGISEAFNDGNIKPTAFIFASRQNGCRGPMFWNHQVLQFAGYEREDGSILGDPNSVILTNAILELGWVPPVSRSPWDLLPLVAMAEGERPAFAEIPPNLRTLVNIRHPRFVTQFEKLDLKWVPFPALTRLGFDIGGVQYTATPFIGWFMDAEIGVRNLADSFRYNALPDIVNALDLTKGKLNHCFETFEDLPEYEKLSMLSIAQAELNYAVNWSFQEARVSMVDSLTASMKWCKFDDEFKEKNGYRLPADPYWLAPPSGSIIPLWHRGGAPNYQPKPMIARHVQDPIKAWGREKHGCLGAVAHSSALVQIQEGNAIALQSGSSSTIVGSELWDREDFGSSESGLPDPESNKYGQPFSQKKETVAIYYCSAGTIAEKLAYKLQEWTTLFAENLPCLTCRPTIESLNSLQVSDLTADKTFLLLVSSTGHGEVPANGLGFEYMCRNQMARKLSSSSRSFKFAVFGNGDSRYASTYNQAANTIDASMKQMGGLPLLAGIWPADTAKEPLPLQALRSWWTELKPHMGSKGPILVMGSSIAEDVMQKYEDHQGRLLSTLKDATLVNSAPKMSTKGDRSILLSLNIHNEIYREMSCIQVLPCNAPKKVEQALRALCVKGSDRMNLIFDEEDPTFARFLTEYVDLERPFLELEWLRSIPFASQRNLHVESLSQTSVAEVLERVVSTDVSPQTTRDYYLQRDICLDMPLLHPKTYSVASSPSYTLNHKDSTVSSDSEVQIMVKINPEGRFSDTFLNDCAPPAFLKHRFVDSKVGPQLRENYLAPIVVVATGAGFGPVRCLLQWRIAIARNATAAGISSPLPNKGISLFVGLKEYDADLVGDVIEEANAHGILDMVEVVLSNPQKQRVYQKLQVHGRHIRDKIMRNKGLVFVCTKGAAAKDTKSTFKNVIGGNVNKMLGERYLEEIF